MSDKIITSLLDTDLYKFTMMQCVFHHFKEVKVDYHFKCRRAFDLSPYADKIHAQISHFCDLRLSEDELSYLLTLPYFKADFIDFLRTFCLNPQDVQIDLSQGFDIKINGTWLNTILYEVPLLAIVSQTYYESAFPENDLTQARENLSKKITFVQKNASEIRFCDFGTRRRFSHAWQQEIIQTLQAQLPKQFDGTSNIYFAKKFNLKPIGTMAHEFLQACQVLAPNIQGSQQFALEIWLNEYADFLGIALTDTLTADIFFQEFNQTLSNRFAGLRQDSGDPIQWGEKALNHYAHFGIDPKSKIFVFSDNLTFPKAAHIYAHFKNKCQPYFGIGTNLTNDAGHLPLDIVIKMTHTNDKPVIKISDSKGKLVSEDDAYLKHVIQLFDLKD